MIHGDSSSRQYKRKRAVYLFRIGEFEYYVTENYSWGYCPRHKLREPHRVSKSRK